MCATASAAGCRAAGEPTAVSEYVAFGLRWRSSIALPFASSPDPADAPDVTVRLGETPTHLPGATGHTPHVWDALPGAALLRVADVARYLVTPREIVVEPRGGNGEDVATFLARSVAAVLLQMRGVVTLHAAAVEMGAGAVLLLGGSGAGKSTLAAALVERGAALLADDVTGLAPAAGGVPAALPAFPRMRLWADVLRAAEPPQRVRRNLEKYWVPAARFGAAPRPVCAAFVLESHNRADFDVEPVPPSRAFWTMWAHTYRKRLLNALGQRPRHYRTGLALARGVPFVRVRRPEHPLRLAELADRIEAHVRDLSLRGSDSSCSPAEGAAPGPGVKGRAEGRAADPSRSLAEGAAPGPGLKGRAESRAADPSHSPDKGSAPGARADTLGPENLAVPKTACPPPASPAAPAVQPESRQPESRRRRPATHRAPAADCRLGPGQAGPGIVWIAAYPKSGSTWTRAVLTNYLQDGDEPASINALIGQWGASARDKFDELIGLDSSDLRPDELARYLPRFRELLAQAVSAPRPDDRAMDGSGRRAPHFAKTHEAYRGPVGGVRFPRLGAVGVVYLVRNPLDVAVSYAHHLQCGLGEAVRWMNDPNAGEAVSASRIWSLLPNPLTTWGGHVSSWLDQSDLRTHAARYEDLLADPRAGFGAIVRFAGLAWDAGRLDRAIEHAAFPRLRAQEAESGYRERQPTAPSFFRAGVAGSWRTALTREQVRALVDAHGPVMARHGYLREAEAFLRG